MNNIDKIIESLLHCLEDCDYNASDDYIKIGKYLIHLIIEISKIKYCVRISTCQPEIKIKKILENEWLLEFLDKWCIFENIVDAINDLIEESSKKEYTNY